MTNRPAAVISDANVLIDYISVERTLVLRLVSEHLFPIKLSQQPLTLPILTASKETQNGSHPLSNQAELCS